MIDHNHLRQQLWSDPAYYKKIDQTDDLTHPGFAKINSYLKQAAVILDVGAGDGAKISQLGQAGAWKIGLEVASAPFQTFTAASSFHGVVGVGEAMPFRTNYFDAVLSFFVIEHVQQADQVISEMIRVLRPGGVLALLAPNYGAPNRQSPNFVGSRLQKLIDGLLADIWQSHKELGWNTVKPQTDSMSRFESDWDTTVEPYLGSLIKYAESLGLTTLEVSSFWSMELEGSSLLQKLLGAIGKRSLYPFKYWGPHLMYIGMKKG